MNAALVRDVDRALVPGIGVPHDSGARVVGEHSLQLARSLVSAIRHYHHARMDRSPDPNTPTVMDADP
jgi:hypothetical protein